MKKNWQKDRNYRKIKNPDGSFICVITVDGEDVEVSLELCEAYSTADRRERYVEESEEGLLLSLNRMAEDGTQLSYLTDRHVESAEDTVFREMLVRQMISTISLLPPEDKNLFYAVVINGMTERDYAASAGLSQKGVNKKKHKILENLRNSVLKTPFFREG